MTGGGFTGAALLPHPKAGDGDEAGAWRTGGARCAPRQRRRAGGAASRRAGVRTGGWVCGWRGVGEAAGWTCPSASPRSRGHLVPRHACGWRAWAHARDFFLTPAWHWCSGVVWMGASRVRAVGVGMLGRCCMVFFLFFFLLNGYPCPPLPSSPSTLLPPPRPLAPPSFPVRCGRPQLSGQVDAAAHERQALERTLKELSSMKPETETYKVIGKMFLLQSQAELSAQVTAELAEAVSSVESRLVRMRGGCGRACFFLPVVGLLLYLWPVSMGACVEHGLCLGGGGFSAWVVGVPCA